MDGAWSRGVWAALVELGDRLTILLPGMLVMLTLFALGLIVGWVVRVFVTRVARALGFDRALERWGLASTLRRSGIVRTPADVLGLVLFWGIFILFASLGIDALGVPGSRGATALVLAFLPPLFAAALILLVGWVVANFLSQGLLIAAVNARVPEARLLARGVHWGVILFAAAT